jgi:hypothetical protein
MLIQVCIFSAVVYPMVGFQKDITMVRPVCDTELYGLHTVWDDGCGTYTQPRDCGCLILFHLYDMEYLLGLHHSKKGNLIIFPLVFTHFQCTSLYPNVSEAQWTLVRMQQKLHII